MVHDFWITGRETISTIRMTGTIMQGQVKMHQNSVRACLEMSATLRGFREPRILWEKHRRAWETSARHAILLGDALMKACEGYRM